MSERAEESSNRCPMSVEWDAQVSASSATQSPGYRLAHFYIDDDEDQSRQKLAQVLHF